jgi:predicted DNA-binding protein YlxM (UPF0122 family)/ferredoxin-like protein FixX
MPMDIELYRIHPNLNRIESINPSKPKDKSKKRIIVKPEFAKADNSKPLTRWVKDRAEKSLEKVRVKFDCRKCLDYATCKIPCDVVEKFISQDEKPQRELTVGLPELFKEHEKLTKSNEEIIVSLFFKDRWKQVEIAKELNISRPYVSKIVKKYRPIWEKSLKDLAKVQLTPDNGKSRRKR